jgi:hypothetical protein
MSTQPSSLIIRPDQVCLQELTSSGCRTMAVSSRRVDAQHPGQPTFKRMHLLFRFITSLSAG